MRVLRVDGEFPDPEAVTEAAQVLLDGGLVVYPTDTLYALGAVALREAAVSRLREAKGREAGKPLPLVAADTAQARALWASFPHAAEALTHRFWPGPLTLILPAASVVPLEVTAGQGTLAIRVPAREVTRRLARAAGALVATSANLAGDRPPSTCSEAVAAVGEAAALALDAGPGGLLPSTLVDLTAEPARLLREGAVPWADVVAVLRRVTS